jgi:TonB family protein
MPLLKELEEPERPPADDDAKPDLGQPVPMQADVPSLALPTDFVQQFDFASLVPQPDLSDMKMLTLPENIRRSGKLMDGVKIFDLSSLDRIPEAVVQTPPVYPMALRGEGPTATVTVLFIVGIDGRVSNARAVDSTDIRFNEAAVIGVSKWRFHAGIKDSRRVVTRMIVPITFSIVAAGEYAH